MSKVSYSVKGTHVIASRVWVDERFGEGAFDRLLSAHSVDWPKILPSGWYDIHMLMRVMEQACSESQVTIFEAYREIAARNAREDLTTIYRAFLRLAGPRGLLNATPTLWRNYVAFGDVEKVKNEPGLHIAICRGIPIAVLDWACGSWSGFVPTAVEVAGGSNPKLDVPDLGEDPNQPGFGYLRAEVTYTPP